MNKKMEASKIIIVVNYVIGVVMLIATVIVGFLDKDIMAMTTLTGLVWTEIGAATAFYFSKAKRENVIKISLSSIKQLQRQNKDELKIENINVSNLIDSINK